MYNFIVPGVAFAVVSSPATYQLTRGIAGSWIASAEGAATPAGLFLHTGLPVPPVPAHQVPAEGFPPHCQV